MLRVSHEFLNSSPPDIAYSRCAEVTSDVETLSEQVKRGEALGARVEKLKADLEVGAITPRASVVIVSCFERCEAGEGRETLGEKNLHRGTCCPPRKEYMCVAHAPMVNAFTVPLSSRTDPARSFKAAYCQKYKSWMLRLVS